MQRIPPSVKLDKYGKLLVPPPANLSVFCKTYGSTGVSVRAMTGEDYKNIVDFDDLKEDENFSRGRLNQVAEQGGGYLHKKGGIRTNWTKRYCQVLGAYLFYSVGPTTAPLGCIPLPECGVTVPSREYKTFGEKRNREAGQGYEMILKSGEGGGRGFRVVAGAEELRNNWVELAKSRSLSTLGRDTVVDGEDDEAALEAKIFESQNFDARRYVDSYFQKNPESTTYKHLKALKDIEGRGKEVLKSSVVGSYKSFVVAGQKIKEVGAMIEKLGRDVEVVNGVVGEMGKINWLGDDSGVWSDSDLEDEEESEEDDDGTDSDDTEEGESPDEIMDRNLSDAGNAVSGAVSTHQYELAVTEILRFYDELEKREYRSRDNKRSVKGLWKEVSKCKEVVRERLGKVLQFKIDRAAEIMDAGRRNKREVLALSDDELELGLMVKMGWGREATMMFCKRRTLGVNEVLHENLGTDDPVVFTSMVAGNFFAKIGSSMRDFIRIFGEGEAGRVEPACMTRMIYWVDTEIGRFCDVVGGGHGLGMLRLPAKGKGGRLDGGKLAEMLKEAEEEMDERGARTIRRLKEAGGMEGGPSVVVAANCLEEIFEEAEEHLRGVGLPILGRVAELMKGKLRGSDGYVSAAIDSKFSSLLV
ncbi:hypothetical protein TrRE_jg4242 [Triparma retinervis]|uniref:Exocyst complex component 8 n=1 Tax=Triparma retinervis TaxID=2557542 RepID=A0A9W6ZAX3_9STRA|nr:hypothetical protein TrRE_jg4242 [Triparma retinervis]